MIRTRWLYSDTNTSSVWSCSEHKQPKATWSDFVSNPVKIHSALNAIGSLSVNFQLGERMAHRLTGLLQMLPTVLLFIHHVPMLVSPSDVVTSVKLSKYQTMRAPNGSLLCATSTPFEVFQSRSQMECVEACQHRAIMAPPCEAVNYCPKAGICQLFYQQVMSYSAQQQDCILIEVRKTNYNVCTWMCSLFTCNAVCCMH